MDIVDLVMLIQKTNNETAWQDIMRQLAPLVNTYARLAPLNKQEDLKQELRIEIIKAVRKFKIYDNVS